MEQENVFKIGLDLDSDLRDIEPGFYTYLLNGTTNSSSARNKGAAESLKSWTKKTRFWNAYTKTYGTFSLPSGNNLCISTCKDVKNNAVVFFNMNSNGYHAIFRYWIAPVGLDPFIEALTMYSPGSPPLTWGTTLGFTVRHYNPVIIESGRFINAWTRSPAHPVFGDTIPIQFVCWTDDNLPLRKLNTADLYLRLQDSQVTIDDEWINLGKYQPGLTPVLSFGIDSTRKTNFLPYKHFQFALRFKYKDGEYSPLSPYSQISMLWKSECLFLNFDRAVLDLNNYIFLSYQIAPHPTVLKVEWFVREGNGVGNATTNPEWYRFAIVDADPSATPDIKFYGDEQTTPLSQIDGRTNFYTIPQKAAHQEFVEGNQIVYGDITEGYDSEPVTATTSEISKDATLSVYPRLKVERISVGYTAKVYSASEMKVGDIIYGFYSIIITSTSSLVQSKLPYSYILTASDIADVDVLGANLASAISLQSGYPVNYNTTTDTLTGGASGAFTLVFAGSSDIGFAFSQNKPEICFKEGAIHKFGIVHMDEFMRQGAMEPLPDLYIKFTPERYPISGAYSYIPKIYGVQFNITSKPPLWAKYYKIVHKCNIQKSVILTATSFAYSADGLLKITVNSYKNFKTGFSGVIAGPPVAFGNRGVVDFEYTEWTGNRLRFITQKVDAGGLIDTAKLIIGRNIDVEIKSVELDTNGNLIISITDFGYPSSNLGANALFEVYKSGFEPVYFELPMDIIDNEGLSYGKIDNPGTVSRAYDFGTTYSTYNGNAYKKWRSLLSGTGPVDSPGQFHLDTFSISDWWHSEFYSKGRVQPETPNMKKQKVFSMLRWTGKIFENTNVNNLNVFDEGNYSILEQKYGAITGLRLIGYTLKVLQWSSCSSVFIGRREVQNADGSTQLVVTDKLIGSADYGEGVYGCKHPSSVYVHGRNLYFFDILNRCFVRNDPNGSDDLSKKKATRYWQTVSELVASNQNSNVITGWDQENKILYALIVVNSQFHDCISFCPDKQYWHGFHSHYKISGSVPIDIYGDCQSGLLAFYKGEPWLLNSGVGSFLKILGEDKPFQAAAVTNAGKEKVKVFNSHAVRSNRKFVITTQELPESEINPLGQKSEIPAGKYKYREGVYYSDTNRNYLRFGEPVNNAAKLYGLINGDQIRGHACETKITFEGNEIVILYSMAMTLILSEKS